MLTGAVESEQSRMVEDVLECVRNPRCLSTEEVRHEVRQIFPGPVTCRQETSCSLPSLNLRKVRLNCRAM